MSTETPRARIARRLDEELFLSLQKNKAIAKIMDEELSRLRADIVAVLANPEECRCWSSHVCSRCLKMERLRDGTDTEA